MERTRKKLPIGVDSFEKVIQGNYYYLDKSLFIKDLLTSHGEVNLFTRPRRFGKTLNMSMLKAFFEIGSERTLFDGLKIQQDRELCGAHQCKYPVVFLSLKGAEGRNYTEAIDMLATLIANEGKRLSYLMESSDIEASDREILNRLIYRKGDITDLKTSLVTIMRMLRAFHKKQVILLIDEYDVPLDKANEKGYYAEMVGFLRIFLGEALKTNPDLYFAVVTGCLRISKESIFTGLNNLKSHAITDARYDEYFGFTEEEVSELLTFYELTDHVETIREWYDGYRFGKNHVYCPWDVINYCDALLEDAEAEPENYWANTSGNSIIRRFVEKADKRTRDEIELLVAGETIEKNINQELTYNELENSIENLWSVLFLTGYLTWQERISGKKYKLMIPNREVRELFTNQIQEWFQENTKTDTTKLKQLCEAFVDGDVSRIEEILNGYLWNSISIRDTAVKKERKENFYHGMLLGLLQYESDWEIGSNVESGEGYCDILIKTPKRTGIVIEIKYASEGNLEKSCQEALCQIDEKKYDAFLTMSGMKKSMKYGIAFYKKDCRVRLS